MEEKIKNYLHEKYNVEVVIVEVERAIHLSMSHYVYRAYLKDDPFAYFSGFYVKSKDKFTKISMDYILFHSKYRKIFRETLHEKPLVLNSYVHFNTDGFDLKNDSLKRIASIRKDDCTITLHAYCFSKNRKDEVDWKVFKPLIEKLKKYPDAEFNVVLSFYSPENFNESDVRSNKFGFNFKYLGVEKCFEVIHKDDLLDSLIVEEANLNTLIKKFEEK